MASQLNISSLKDKISMKLNKQNEKISIKHKKQNDLKVKNLEILEKEQKERLLKKEENKNNNDLRQHGKLQKSFGNDTTKTTQKKNSNNNNNNNNNSEKKEKKTWKEEALELGAKKEDLEMLESLKDDDEENSEQEFGGDDDDDEEEEGVKTGLKDELKNMMNQIGLGDVKVDDVVEDDEDVEDDVEDDVEEAAEEDVEEDFDEDVQEEIPELSSTKKETEKDGLITETSLVVSDKLLLSTTEPWYEMELDTEATAQKNDPLNEYQISKLFEKGKETLLKDNDTYYQEFTKNSSQRKFMSQILNDGTLNDKISALTLLIQESPLHNVKSLDILVGYCNKKSRNSILQSLNAIKDLFLNNGLLPKDKKLKFFKNQNLSLLVNKKTLAIWYFEDYLKNTFYQILEFMEKLSHDPITHIRMTILTHIFDFVTSTPEQEFNLLRLGVNKLGDIDNKVSSKTSYQLLKLQNQHPNMKQIIIDNIVDVALKKNEGYHTIYYAVLTLNQTILKKTEFNLANSLIKVYFTLFEKFLINSSFTQNTDKNDYKLNKQMDQKTSKSYELNKRKKNVKKGRNGGVSVKLNIKTEQEVIEEKNTKLFSAILTGLNRSFPFSDLPSEIYEQRLDTLFKITHSSNFNTSIQSLVLIFQVISKKTALNPDRYYKTLYESLLDPRLVSSSKQGIYLNLLYKSLKFDTDIARIEAFVKRILQICLHWSSIGVVAGMFYLLIQLQTTVPQIKNLLINSPTDYTYESDNDEEEEEAEAGSDGAPVKAKKNLSKARQYDSRKRDPKFANADKSSLWEITHFLQHFHPTVQTYAKAFIGDTSEDVENLAKPDLGLYTLAHFLDRFVYRNFKQKQTARGSSIMQPLGGQHTGSLLVKASDKVLNELPANTENWLSKKTKDIKPDEKFFHQYFSTKQTAIKKSEPSTKKSGDDFDAEESNDEMEEDEIWDALVKSRPDVEGDDEEEDDIDLDGEDFSMSDDDASDDSGVELDLGEVGEEEVQESEDEDDDDDLDVQALISGEDDSSEEEEDDELAAFDAEEDENTHEKEAEEEEGETADSKPISKKRFAAKEESKKTNKKNKKAIKELPLFASADEYAKYMESD